MDRKNFIHHYNNITSFKKNSNSRKLTNLSIGILKLQFLFDIKSFPLRAILVFFTAIISGTGNFLILEKTGLYSLGINSLFQAIARCVVYFLSNGSGCSNGILSPDVLHPILFWCLNVLFNIPLAIFGYKKIGNIFAILSILFITTSSLTSFLLFWFSEKLGLKDFYLFSDPRTFNTSLISKKINILQWSSAIKSSSNGDSCILNDSSKIVIMFCYGFVFGLLNTFTSLVVFAVGGSLGGVDWLAFYLSKKKNYSTTFLLLIFGLIITFLSYTIGTYIPYVHHMLTNSNGNGTSLTCKPESSMVDNTKTKNLISNFFSPVLLSTILSAFTKKFCFSSLYPQFKLIKVKIFSNKVVELRHLLLSSDFPHSFTINHCAGGYLLRKQTTFEIVCFALELKTLINYVRKIDPSCLIVATSIKTFSGHLRVQSYLN